jgi:hypothetical protein
MLLHFCTRNRGNKYFNIIRPLALEFGLIRVILIRPPSSFDYRTRHGSQSLQGCVTVVLQDCVIVALQGCVIVVLQDCMIVALQCCKIVVLQAELFGPGHFVGLGLGLRLKSEIRTRTRART